MLRPGWRSTRKDLIPAGAPVGDEDPAAAREAHEREVERLVREGRRRERYRRDPDTGRPLGSGGQLHFMGDPFPV